MQKMQEELKEAEQIKSSQIKGSSQIEKEALH